MDKKIKVLMFGWEFPPHITGGLGTACYGLTKGLSDSDIKVIFVVPKIFGDEDSSFMEILAAENYKINFQKKEHKEYFENLTYIEINSKMIPYISPEEFEIFYNKNIKKDEIKEKVFSSKFKFSGKYDGNLMKEVFRYSIIAGSISQKYDFDLIHAHDWLTYPAGIAAKKASGKPLIIHVHATEYDRSGENVNPTVFHIEKMGMEEADKIVTVSNLTKQILISKYSIDPNKIETIHNAVDFNNLIKYADYKKTIKEKIVTFLGRITFQKGPDYFVEAAYKVLQRYDNVRFVMAGSGDMFHKMIKRVADLGISDKFHFAGFLKGEEVDKLFAISDVYVMPSVSEPFGISPLEAMRSNVPVIISKQSGVAEILKHAIKVDFWDIDAISDSIYGLLKYDGLSRMFRNYSRDEVSKLKWKQAALKLKEVYKKII